MKTTNAQGSKRLPWFIIGCLGFTCFVLCIGIVIAVVYYYPLIQQRGFSPGVIETQVMLTLEATPLEAQEQLPIDTQPVPTQEIVKAQIGDINKPEKILQKIIEGKMEKSFYSKVSLLDQPFIKDDSKNVKSVIMDAIAKLGENIVVTRFVRYALGEQE